jgi:hypothetical protein
MRKFVAGCMALLAAGVLAGCVTVHGPTSFTLSREDIERAIEADLGSMIEILRGLDVRRPEVAFMPVAGRVELAWYVTLPVEPASGTLFGSNVGVAVVISGQPKLNPARTGIDLTDVKLDDVRALGLPRMLGFGLGAMTSRKGSTLPDLPLINFSPSLMRVADVAYGATALEVTYRGLRVDIAPR